MSINLKMTRRCAGISLIEMMICLTILAIVALALANGMMASMSGTSTTEERAAAVRTAEQRLARLVAFGRNIIAPDDGATYPSLDLDLSNGVVKNLRAYKDGSGSVITDTGAVWTSGMAPTATFDVSFTKVDSAGRGNAVPATLPPLNPGNQKTGELVVWFSEVDPVSGGPRTGASYGRDLNGGLPTTACPMGAPDGNPDGVNFDFAAVGYDLDMDGQSKTVNILTNTANSFQNNSGRVPVGAVVRWFGCDGREQRVEVWSVVDFSSYSLAAQ